MPRSALQKARDAPQSTKARILAAAEAVFASKGFAGASTREIAAAAGVNISSLHYHWESKETLYFAVFRNVYDQLLEVVRSSLAKPGRGHAAAGERWLIEQAMGHLFDFFADRPNVTKLLVRRLVESDEGTAEVEQDVLLPAWRMFAQWMQESAGRKLAHLDVQLFMLTVHSVLLVFLLDSQQYVSVLGGSVRSPHLRRRLRSHIIDLVQRLLTGRSHP